MGNRAYKVPDLSFISTIKSFKNLYDCQQRDVLQDSSKRRSSEHQASVRSRISCYIATCCNAI